ncbi:MAG: polysaccharide biosynthesis protein [Clostridiaceae bacterium]|nr:polysaccharide biosynthesis protein [Clostridiaceae bacterium]
MKHQSETKGFTILSIASVINKLLGLLYVPFLTLILGNVGNGIYDAGYKIYQLVFMITNAGIPVAISKLISEQAAVSRYDLSHKTLKVSGGLLAAIGALLSIIIAVFARQFSVMIGFPESYMTILALSPTLLFTSISCAFRGYFQGRSNMVPTSISQVIEQGVNTVFTVLFAWIMYRYGTNYAVSHGITGEAEIRLEAVKFAAAGGTVGTSLGALTSALYLCRVYIKNKAEIVAEVIESSRSGQFIDSTKMILKKIFRYAVPITLGAVAIYTASLIDLRFTKSQLIAGGFSEIDATGLYGILSTQYLKVLFIPITFATALATTILPSVSAASARNDGGLLHKRIYKSIKLILMIAVPSAVGLTVLAKPIIYSIFPQSPDGWDLLMVGSWTLILISLVSIQTAILQGMGKTYVPTIHMAIGLVLKVFVNYNLIVIPSVNIKGAIAGSAVCYGFAAFMNYRSIKKLTGVRLSVKRLFNRPLTVSVVMGVLVFLIYHGLTLMTDWLIKSPFLQNIICTAISIGAGALIYYLLMIVARGITEDEIRSFPKGDLILEITRKIPYMERFI